jgi:hypothetical protein
MVVPTDIQIAFAAGAFLADIGARVIEAARDSEDRLSKLYSQYRLRALIYAAVFLGPVATVSLLGWPAWETQYWSPAFDATADNPVNASYFGIFLIAVFIAGWFGNWLGFKWVLSGARKRLRALYTVVLVLTVGLVLVRWPAPIRLGSYAEFKSDPGALPNTWQNTPFAITFWILLAVCAIPMIIWLIQVRKSVKAIDGA